MKRAYRRAVSASHPDKHRGAPEMEKRLRALNAAYAMLSDPAKRAAYDRSIAAPPKPKPKPVVVIVPEEPDAIALPKKRWDYWLAAAFFGAGVLILLLLSATEPATVTLVK